MRAAATNKERWQAALPYASMLSCGWLLRIKVNYEYLQ